MNEIDGDFFDAFSELQLAPDAEPELVKAAFKALAKKYHPDRFTDPQEKAIAEAKMARLNEAQRQIQNGTYRRQARKTAPPKETKETPSKTPSGQPAKTEPSPTVSKTPKKPIPLAPFLGAALFFLALLVIPPWFSDSNLKRAQQLEAKGQLFDALHELNQAILQSPHKREYYRHRARIWDKLGEPEKAKIDRQNFDSGQRGLQAPKEVLKADQVPSTVDENSEDHVP